MRKIALAAVASAIALSGAAVHLWAAKGDPSVEYTVAADRVIPGETFDVTVAFNGISNAVCYAVMVDDADLTASGVTFVDCVEISVDKPALFAPDPNDKTDVAAAYSTPVLLDGDYVRYTFAIPESAEVGSKISISFRTVVYNFDNKEISGSDVTKVTAVVVEAPETEAPETEAPETEAPETEAPETEAPETEAPETEAPETEAPETEAPETEAPETEAPETEAPETEAPETEAPETEAPETEAPETEAPETEAPETEAPETEAPETEAPETEAPETEAPETEAPETEAPETEAPETEALETEAPETEAPETEAPETEAPETEVESLKGDIDLSGFVDISDAVLLFRHSMVPSVYPIEYTGNIDLNLDGEVNIQDAVLLFQHSMLPDLYPLPE